MTDEASRGRARRRRSHARPISGDAIGRRARVRRVDLPDRLRILFAGPVGAGKTTAVRALSDVRPVDTDVPITAGAGEHGDGDKTTTTVGLDYGTWRPTSDISVALIGVPGQDRFAHARRSTISSDTRIVLWLRADRRSIAADAEEWIPRFAGALDRLVIAVSHCTEGSLDRVRLLLLDTLVAQRIPADRILAADARNREDVMRVACAALDLPEEEP